MVLIRGRPQIETSRSENAEERRAAGTGECKILRRHLMAGCFSFLLLRM